MARIPCRECKKLVYVGNRSCPHCGASLKGAPVSRGVKVAVFAVLGLLVIAVAQDYDPSPISASSAPGGLIVEKGYFKDEYRNRIRSYLIKADPGPDVIRAHAEGLPHTDGRLMAAYYYWPESSIPHGALTMSNTVHGANTVVYESPSYSGWRYAYVRFLNGSSRLVDCAASPTDDLCRNGG